MLKSRNLVVHVRNTPAYARKYRCILAYSLFSSLLFRPIMYGRAVCLLQERGLALMLEHQVDNPWSVRQCSSRRYVCNRATTGYQSNTKSDCSHDS